MSDYSAPPPAPSSASPPAPYSAPDDDTPPLKEKASDAAQAAKQASTGLAETAGEKARDVAQETTKQARDLVGEARQQLRQQAGSQHRSLVANLRSLGDELGGMSQHSEQSGVATELVSQARDRVHGVADWLEEREPSDVVDELRSLARRRPGTFLLGAALSGVVAGRLTRGVAAIHTSDTGISPRQSSWPAGSAAQAEPSGQARPSDQVGPAPQPWPAAAPATGPEYGSPNPYVDSQAGTYAGPPTDLGSGGDPTRPGASGQDRPEDSGLAQPRPGASGQVRP
jgi:hypothetical protein